MKKADIQTRTDSYVIRYPEFIELTETQQDKCFWTSTEIKVKKDIQDLRVNLPESDRHGVLTVLGLFVKYELLVGGEYWLDRVFNRFPIPEIQRMAACFGNIELGVHGPFYNQINEVLGLATDEFYGAWREDPVLVDRISFIDDLINEEDDALSVGGFSFIEGAVLYSNFAFLKHYQNNGKNYMMNVVRGVNHSAIDECLIPGTEVLTTRGWKNIEEATTEDEVAQFDPKTSEITFTNPIRVVKKHTDRMIRFSADSHGQIEQIVTPNHRVLQRSAWDKKPGYKFKEADKAKYYSQNCMPVSGFKVGGRQSLTDLERFKIATQADGFISKRYTGKACGTRPVVFSFSKQRKIDRMHRLLQSLGFDYKILEEERKQNPNRNLQTIFKVNVPAEIVNKEDLKSFDWVNILEVSSKWCSEFVEEVFHWDGYVKEGYSPMYSNTNKSCIDLVQTLAHLCGKSSSVSHIVDHRSESYRDCYKLTILDKCDKAGGTIKKENYQYSGDAHCITVDKGAFLIRSGGRISVTGNCLHAIGGALIFRKLLEQQERSEEELQTLKSKIFQIAQKVYEHESRIIEKIFEKGAIQGITAHQLEEFAKSRVNICLEALGYERLYTVTYNPIAEWFYDALNKYQFNDFFTATGREYVRHWDETGFGEVWEIQKFEG